MTEWKIYKLSEVAIISTGFPFAGEKYAKEGIRVVRGDNVTIGALRWDNDKLKCWNEPFARANEFSLMNGDIVVGMDGSRVGLNRAQVKETDLPLLLAQRVACIRHNEKTTQDFLYYQIFSERFVKYIKQVQTGTSIPHVSLKQIGGFEVSLPSLEEQWRIAGILGAIDDKIENNRRINTNLELQAQALYKQWFVDFEFPNEEGKPYKSSGGKMVDSELGPIPEGWCVGKLEDIGDIIGGGTPSKAVAEYYTKNGIAWITPKDLSVSHLKFTAKGETDITELGYKNSSAKIMPRGSVLFSSRAPIGYISIAKNDICTNQGFKSVVPNNGWTAFVYYFLLSNTENIESKATGSTFKEASGALMKSLDLVIPSEDILEKFETIMSHIFESQEKFEAENKTLVTLRDTLLPKLMNGEIKTE